MRFKVRDGFVVHRIKEVAREGAMIHITTTPHGSGEEIDLSADEAANHLHKLDAVDEEAHALMRVRTPEFPAPAESTDESAVS